MCKLTEDDLMFKEEDNAEIIAYKIVSEDDDGEYYGLYSYLRTAIGIVPKDRILPPSNGCVFSEFANGKIFAYTTFDEAEDQYCRLFNNCNKVILKIKLGGTIYKNGNVIAATKVISFGPIF